MYLECNTLFWCFGLLQTSPAFSDDDDDVDDLDDLDLDDLDDSDDLDVDDVDDLDDLDDEPECRRVLSEWYR